jgi:hypothetical protein
VVCWASPPRLPWSPVPRAAMGLFIAASGGPAVLSPTPFRLSIAARPAAVAFVGCVTKASSALRRHVDAVDAVFSFFFERAACRRHDAAQGSAGTLPPGWSLVCLLFVSPRPETHFPAPRKPAPRGSRARLVLARDPPA